MIMQEHKGIDILHEPQQINIKASNIHALGAQLSGVFTPVVNEVPLATAILLLLVTLQYFVGEQLKNDKFRTHK